MKTPEELFQDKVKGLLIAKYGRSRNIGPGTLSIVVKVAIIEGWVTEKSIKYFDSTPKILWGDLSASEILEQDGEAKMLVASCVKDMTV